MLPLRHPQHRGGLRLLLTQVLLVAFVVVACSGGGGQVAPSGTGTVRFERWQISDLMAGGAIAVRYLAPSGWQSTGVVEWLPQWQRLVNVQTRVVDPSTGLTIEWLPVQDFIWFQAPAGLEAPIGSNYQGKAYVPPVTDPAQFVADFWMPGMLAHLQSATLVSSQQVPAVAAEFKLQFGGPADAAAYRLRYEYNQNGQPWQEDVSFALLYAGGPELTSWYVNYAYTVRAPKGELERSAGVASTIASSRLTTPEWEAVYRVTQRLFTQGIQQQMADTAAFGQLLAQHRAETQALQDQVTQERQASQDRIAQLNGEILSGVQTFVDPVNQTLVQLPNGGSSYWVNGQGEYVVTDQPGFDPGSLGGGWQQLQPRTF